DLDRLSMTGLAFIDGDIADVVLTAKLFGDAFECTRQSAGRRFGPEHTATGGVGEVLEIFSSKGVVFGHRSSRRRAAPDVRPAASAQPILIISVVVDREDKRIRFFG